MDDKSLVPLHRTARQHAAATKRAHSYGAANIQLVEDIRNAGRQRFVDHNAKCPLVIVFPQIGDGVGKIRVDQLRHGDEELVFQGCAMSSVCHGPKSVAGSNTWAEVGLITLKSSFSIISASVRSACQACLNALHQIAGDVEPAIAVDLPHAGRAGHVDFRQVVAYHIEPHEQ